MKVCHDEQADAGDDHAPEFDALIRVNTAGHVVGNRFIEKYHGATRDKDK